MRGAAVLAGCLAIAACTADEASVPVGWSVETIQGCCTIGVPSQTLIEQTTYTIDDSVMILHGRDFRAMITLTTMGSAVPPASAGTGYRAATRRIDGRAADTASFTAVPARSPLPETRSLLWKIKEPNDGTGRNLLVDFSCRAGGCDVFEPMIASLRVK